jgi:uncharacterized phage-associated protein
MAEIKFRFNLEKLVHALAFFSAKGISDLTKLKAAKLLYFADKEHLLKYGRPILGDVYFCLPYGPVPSFALNEMTDALARPEGDDSDRSAFERVLAIRRPLWGGYPRFQLKHGFDSEVFSESELEALEHVAREYGQLSARALVSLTHQEPTWVVSNKHRSPQSCAPIPYELFFIGAPAESNRVLELVKAEQQENRELDELVRNAKAASAQNDQVPA